MFKSNIKRNKRVLILFLLFFGLAITNLSTSIVTNTSNNSNNTFIENNPNDKDSVINLENTTLKIAGYLESIESTGGNFNITLHQSLRVEDTPLFEIANVSNTRNNTVYVTCPRDTTFNSTYSYITIENINAPNATLIVEDTLPYADEFDFTNSNPGATSFIVKGDGYIENVSVYCRNTYAAVAVIKVYLYNSTWDNDLKRNIPVRNSESLINQFNIPSGGGRLWRGIINQHEPLDNSKTENNTWFIGLKDGGDGSGAWCFVDDDNSAGGNTDFMNETWSYNNPSGTEWVLIESTVNGPTVDLYLKLGLSPEANIPLPSDIGLKINDTAIDDNVAGSGNWNKTVNLKNLSQKINYTLSAEWWNVSCDVRSIQVNYTKSNLMATSIFNISSPGGNVFWNVTRSGQLNYFDSNFANYWINITIPASWSNVKFFNGTDEVNIFTSGQIINGFKKYQVFTAGNLTSWYLNATSLNFLYSINTYIGPIQTNAANYTDILRFEANFTSRIESNDGAINLTVYTPDLEYSNFTTQNETYNSGKMISLANWTITTINTYGNFRTQLYWHNDTTAGFIEKNLTIFAKTDLMLISPVSGVEYFKDDPNFNITVYFNNTGKSIPITPDTVQYQNGSITGDLTNNGTLGYYYLTINPKNFDLELNTIKINASKQYYNNKTIYFDFSVVIHENTQLSLISPVNESYYFKDDPEFNITVYFNETEQSVPIVADNAQFWNGTQVGSLTPNGTGYYYLTVNPLYFSIGPNMIKINASKHYYNNKTIYFNFTVKIHANTNLSLVSPKNNSYYFKINSKFNVTVYFNETDIGRGPIDTDNVLYWNGTQGGLLSKNGTLGYYNLTINPNDYDFGLNMIEINASRQYYDNKTIYFSFHVVIYTNIGHNGSWNLGSVMREQNTTCTFNYTDVEHNLIANAEWTNLTYNGFVGYLQQLSPGLYKLHLNTSKVVARSQPYYYNFTIQAEGNETKRIELIVTVLLPIAEFANFSFSSNVAVLLGSNLTITFIFNDTLYDRPITTLTNDSVTVIDLSTGFNWPYGWRLYHNGQGNYTLNIGTSGLIDGNRYNIRINITYSSQNPGPYNDTIKEISFYYGHIPSTNGGTDGDGGGGGGGGGGGTTIIEPPPNVIFGIPVEQFYLYMSLIAIGIGAVVGSVAVRQKVVVPRKLEKERILTEAKTIFDDAINLEHVLVLYRGTGMCIFFKSFGTETIDPELISGFLSAVSSFGREMESQESLNEITYGDKTILLSDGEFTRVALVLAKKASIILRKHLQEFINAFEKIYQEALPNWRGQLNVFRNAGEIVDDKLNTSIILPHKISYDLAAVKTVKSSLGKQVLDIASNLLKESNRDFFFIATLLKEATENTGKDTAQIFMGIKELRDKKIFVPIEISAIEAAPISQQEIDLLTRKVCDLTNLPPEECKDIVKELGEKSPAEREAYFASLEEKREIVSAPIKSKIGAITIDTVKSAKKEINNLKKNAKALIKEKEAGKAIEIYENAATIARNWELNQIFEELENLIRITSIDDFKKKYIDFEKEAKIAFKEEKYGEAAQKYKKAAEMASEIFKLGVTEMTNEVKRLTNKSKECEKLK